MLSEDMQVAAAVWARILEWRGSEFLELIYLLEEKNAFDIFRQLSRLSESDKSKLIKFMNSVYSENSLEVRTYDSEIAIRAKKHAR